MAAWIRGSALLLAVWVHAAALQAGTPAVPPGEDWYPADVAPPPGTRYPCALTALPRELPGIPAGDRRFINHVYSLLLRATQAKLVLQKALAENQGPALASAHGQYRRATGDAMAKIRAEPVPAGLDKFRDHVIAALDFQRTVFAQAVQARLGGGPVGGEYKVPEARAASQQLIAAWTQMMQRYPNWPAEMKDSVYHHLCALDLF